MKLRLVRKRPKFLPGGDIQQVNETAMTNSQPEGFLYGQDLVGNNIYFGENGVDENGETVISPYINQPSQKLSAPSLSPAFEYDLNPISYSTTQEKETKRHQDGNPLDPMSSPYWMGGMPDIPSRVRNTIGSIQRAGDISQRRSEAKEAGESTIGLDVAQGFNVASGVSSAVSAGMGFVRELKGMQSAENARRKDEQSYRQKLANERRNSFIRYAREGGTNLGDGQSFDTSSLTGEYIYPLPKSMEDNANVEIEKGEYALVDGIEGPMEAKGERHEKGGTPVNIPSGEIVSDYRTITEDFAAHVRENYGIKATPKDTYASLLDKFKNKIGLKQKYEDQEKIFNKLTKNQDVKDKNTSNLNKSILSKYVSENQSEIDIMEQQFRGFADVVYKEQEDNKRNEKMDEFFREGGPIDIRQVRKMAKSVGLSEKEAKDLLYDEYLEQRRIMAVGGPTKEDEDLARRRAELMRQTFGRSLDFAIVDPRDVQSVLNADTNINANQGLQHRNNMGFGNATATARQNLIDVNRWARPLESNNEFDVEGFQIGYNKQLNDIWSLANAGIISNADAAKAYRDQYGFWGQANNAYDQGDNSAYNSFAIDNKFGNTTASRSFYSLSTVTPEQRRLLNEQGIQNYVDLFGDKGEQAKKILGSDYDKFQKMQDSGLFDNMDFVLGEYNQKPRKELGQAPMLEDLGDTSDPELNPIEYSAPTRVQRNPQEKKPTVSDISRNGFNLGAIFPEVLRPMDSGLTLEGLERHQAPRVDPVLRSADQYINELNRVTNAQMQALGDVPDSQRAAILSNLNAVAGDNIAKYINEVSLYNAQQINEADRFNEMAYVQTDDKNIAERQRYEAGALKAMAIADENRARYYDSINNEVQQKWNVQTSLNTIASIAPNMRMLPNGQIVYVQGNEDIFNVGDYSTPRLRAMNEEEEERNKRKKGSR